ncbi:MAG: TIR domain-containing protein, partial [Candidatus Eremiobacteraeota bacterium]|nr:TIR domain-containing protein [Candidatus Eremiobacteraeota bacterium]
MTKPLAMAGWGRAAGGAIGVEPEVFICHSSADAASASDICARLEESGIRCWIAPRDPLPGIPYGEQLVNAVAAARVVLLVLSAHANESRAVLGEIELASNRGKIILPVRIENVAPSSSLEFYVRAIHWFDAVTDGDEAWPKLVAHVRTLVGQAAPIAPPRSDEPRAVTAPPHNLPLQLTSFVGREQDLAEIQQLLYANRLVTLIGSGGAGKTRAAIQVGEKLLDGFTDGVWLVELAPISDGSLVPAAIARV